MNDGELHRSPSIERLFIPFEGSPGPGGPAERHAVIAHEAAAAAVHVASLDHLEQAGTDAMAQGRLHEYATARACAHAGLRLLGHDGAIERTGSGAPAWPAGVTGSISHTEGHCAAAASLDPGRVIGLDIERADRVRPAVARRILTDAEQSRIDLDSADVGQIVATAFAAKEAFYKAHHQLDPRYLGFSVIEVHHDHRTGRLRFSPGDGDVATDVIERAAGRVEIIDGRVVAAVWIGRTGEASTTERYAQPT